MSASERVRLGREQLPVLFEALRAAGYTLVGPRERSRAVVYDVFEGDADLATGRGENRGAGVYRLTRRGDEMVFGGQVPQHSWKPFLFAFRTRLWRARRDERGFSVEEEPRETPRYAFIGVRPCDLLAIAVQDRTLLDGPFADPDYRARREGLFVVAVNCLEPGGTCFCASMGTGPRATHGFDLALTELLDTDGHRFLVEVGSARGAEVLARTNAGPASAEDCQRADELLDQARGLMGRTLDTNDLPGLLAANLENPRWDHVARRCLACTNCTLVCPTCFCASLEDHSDLSGREAERVRRWDSCFTLDHSRLHGGSVRRTHRARYRQWLTHKVGTWVPQFGVSGCVGCGRCITWCPVGIDLTEELAAIRASDARSGHSGGGHG